jgi:FkbM family methyltransferase
LEIDIFQEWSVLKGDNTLSRAIDRVGLKDVLEYQKDHLETAFKYCGKGKTRHAIDIGANYGLMTYNMSKYFDHVSSFEIVPEVNECFKLNAKKFKLNNVSIYDCGLGNKEETVALNFDSNKTFSTHVDPTSHGNIKVKTLDSFEFKNVDFIKIDVEGYETFIIQGAIDTIKKYKPVILYERKGHSLRYNQEKNSVFDILKNYGYRELENVGSKNALIGVV